MKCVSLVWLSQTDLTNLNAGEGEANFIDVKRLSNNYLNHIRIAFAHIKSDSSCIQHFDSPT